MDLTDKRILLVDDEPTITEMLSFHLQSAGYENIESLNNPLHVADKVAEFMPDVLLLDVSMPEMDGLKVLELLAELVTEDSLTVIMVTNLEQEYIQHRALILGACDFITKPVDPQVLADRVGEALRGRPNRDFILDSLPPKKS